MKVYFYFLCFAFLFSCKSNEKTAIAKNYTLFQDDDGIWVEQFDSTVVDVNRYNQNNIIYKVGRAFTYTYEYIDIHGNIKKYIDSEDDWTFADPQDTLAVSTIEISVKNGLEPMIQNNPGYNQTVVGYKYDKGKWSSASGAIENEKNVWIHPPRDQFFAILELNPFPYIRAPYDVGNKWSWNLGIGSFWGDERWTTWEGSIENNYSYEIVGKSVKSTGLGQLECIEVKSEATSRIGKTHLSSLFNTEYGFVKLDYTNIDGSKLIMELVEVK